MSNEVKNKKETEKTGWDKYAENDWLYSKLSPGVGKTIFWIGIVVCGLMMLTLM